MSDLVGIIAKIQMMDMDSYYHLAVSERSMYYILQEFSPSYENSKVAFDLECISAIDDDLEKCKHILN